MLGTFKQLQFLSLIISPTHLALWLNRVELTGNFPFLEWYLIQAVISNEQPFPLPTAALGRFTDSSQ